MAEKILYTSIAITNGADSEIVITGEIPTESLPLYRARALKNLGEHVALRGFRKGHIPERVLINAIGDIAVLEETASLALSDAYPAILKEHIIDALGRPRITLTKLAPGNPIGFSIETAVVPPIFLPDYASIAQKINARPDDGMVEEKEIEEAMRHIQESVSRAPSIQHNAAENEEKSPKETAPLPELTDAFVQQLGDFKDVADFRAKLTERLREEKKMRAREKKRVEIADNLVAASGMTLPKVLVESELAKMLGRLKEDLQRANIPFDEYLAHLKKTEEDIRNNWKEEAKKRAKLQLILNAIAEKEKISTPSEETERQTTAILQHNRGADPEKVRIYVGTMLTNESVFQLLERHP